MSDGDRAETPASGARAVRLLLAGSIALILCAISMQCLAEPRAANVQIEELRRLILDGEPSEYVGDLSELMDRKVAVAYGWAWVLIETDTIDGKNFGNSNEILKNGMKLGDRLSQLIWARKGHTKDREESDEEDYLDLLLELSEGDYYLAIVSAANLAMHSNDRGIISDTVGLILSSAHKERDDMRSVTSVLRMRLFAMDRSSYARSYPRRLRTGFKQLLNEGNPEIVSSYGIMLGSGFGGEIHPHEALKWLFVAKRLGAAGLDSVFEHLKTTIEPALWKSAWNRSEGYLERLYSTKLSNFHSVYSYFCHNNPERFDACVEWAYRDHSTCSCAYFDYLGDDCIRRKYYLRCRNTLLSKHIKARPD